MGENSKEIITGGGSNSAGVNGVAGSNSSASTVPGPSAASTNPLAASLSGIQGYNNSMDPNAALMMTNAAAAIAAVAAQAVQHMAAQQQQQKPRSSAVGGASGFPSSLFAAALQGNRNSFLSNTTSTHPALLVAAANAGQHSSVPGIGTSRISGHDGAASVASSLLRPSGPGISQHSSVAASSMTTPAMLTNMQTWTLEQLGKRVALSY
jgi:hypothetical protein